MSFSESTHPNANLGSVQDANSKRNAYKFQGGTNTFNNANTEEIVSAPPRGGKKFPPIPQVRPLSQTFDNVESISTRGRGPSQMPKIVGQSYESNGNGSPRPGLYSKKPSTSTSSVGNGTVSAANNASSRSQKVRRQNSMGTFGLQRMASFNSEMQDEFEVRPSVVDPDKIEAAKKRLLETKNKKSKIETIPKRTWKQRFKWCGTTLVSLTIILSSSTLLFVVPIVVDPILIGLDAQFSSKPVQCRTVSYENETGPMNCAMQRTSCREGCTADLYACIFILVVYTKETLSTANTFYNSSLEGDNSSRLLQFSIPDKNPNTTFFNGTLFVNPGGCGYPPDVNCSIFDKMFREVGTVFPCYYSSANSSLVVPFYSRHEELVNLSVALGIPFGLLFVSSVSLFLLLRWDLNRVKDITTPDSNEDEEDLEAWRFSNSRSESTEILTMGSSKRNGKISYSKYNGHGPGGKQSALDNLSSPTRSLDSSSALHPEAIDLKRYSRKNLKNGLIAMSDG